MTKTKKIKKKIKSNPQRLLTTLGVLFACLFLSFACTYTPFKDDRNSASSPAAAEDRRTEIEKDLDTMRNANYDHIFVFRRKDGGEFDDEDKKYLRANTPLETNRFYSSENGRAFTAGSNFPFPPESLEVLRLRFNVEDHSAQNK